MSTSCNLPDSEFATPLWSRGTLVGGVEMRANAERLSPVEALVSPSDNRSRAERLADGVADFSPAGRGVPCGVMLGEVIRSRGGRGDGV